MESMAQQIHPGPPQQMRGGFRGRGGVPMRGYDTRGRGRGMGRGGPMGMRMVGPMMRGRGGMMRGGMPRGMGYPRSMPRGQMRGGRPPVYFQAQNLVTQQQLAPTENSNNVVATTVTTENNTTVTVAAPPATTAAAATTPATVTSSVSSITAPANTTPAATYVTLSVRGYPRGRGGLSRGRGAYMGHSNGISQDSIRNPMSKPYRGGIPRGRGGYSQMHSRPPVAHSANTQVTPVPTLKRGAPSGMPGSKRGRYDQNVVNRQLIPKHQPQVQAVHPPQQHNSYINSSGQNHHASYQGQEQIQPVDQYSQAYVAPPPQTTYNGYGQASYASTANTGYAQGTEYDHSQYQTYNTTSYNQQDNRYSQAYSQDYIQAYGAPAVDYSAPPPEYSQQQYDDRTYAVYDTQNYTQGYTSASGYY